MLAKLEQLQKVEKASKSILKKNDGYNFNTPAEALLFNAYKKAVRVEAPFIGKEFTDGEYIGTDPGGLLYYDAIRDLDDGQHVYFKVDQFTQDGEKYVWIGWFREFPTHPYQPFVYHAEFIAPDRNDIVTTADMHNYDSEGDWKDLSICSASAVVDKRTDESAITVVVPGVKRSATIPAPEEILRQEFRVKGTLWFKNLDAVNTGVWASYSNDRVVFIRDELNDRDFTAYFIPFENEEDLHVTSIMELEGVEWFNSVPALNPPL